MTEETTALLERAEAALLAGDAAGALAALDQLPETAAGVSLAHYFRAAALFATGEAAAGEQALAQGRHLHALGTIEAAGGDVARLAADPAYAYEVGRRFYNAKQMVPAAVAFAFAGATHSPQSAQAVQLYGEALHYEGRAQEAATAFAAAYRLEPGVRRHCLYVYSQFFLPDGARRHAGAARAWARQWADPFTPARPSFLVERRGDRRLRIGYVAPSFTTNQTRKFFHPLLEAHDPEAAEIFLYVDRAADERAPAHVQLRSIKDLLPGDVAEQIRRDRIDILVDVWGHAAGNVLQAFALKPAPVQASWLNYMQTTGLSAMDAVLHGDFMDAPGKAELFTEAIWDLGPVTGLFQPDPHAELSPSPAEARGHVTFASFNHPAKLSLESLQAWARILKACPTARLKFKYAPFEDPILQAQLQVRFLGWGVAPARLEFEGHSTGPDYERAFAEIDLALDPSPCPGGTTTLEAFSRGVPVLTLDSGDFYARIGVQPMMALGLPEMVATDWDDYVAKAIALADDIPRLARLRAEIRPRFDASAYRDGPAFARRLEDVYRRLFQHWLAREGATREKAA